MRLFRSFRVVIGLTVFVFGALGCGGGGARELMIPTTRIKAPEADYALVTFVRSSVMAFGVKVMLWDKENLIGELSPRKYVQYKAEPGKHLFLAKAENWFFLNANLSPGKHYIVRVKVVPGGYSAGVELAPALPFEDKVTKAEVDEWLFGLEAQRPMVDYAEVYKTPYLPEVRSAVKKYDEGKVDYITLNPGDDWPHLALNPPEDAK